MTISRRRFIENGLGLMGMCLSASHMLTLAAQAAEFNPRVAGKKILVVVQMGGGNDGLNTVVPYGNGAYYQQRPLIGIKPDKVLPLNDQLGLNPTMGGFHSLFRDGKVAIVQGVGYPSPNRSHFRSIEIWQTGNPDKIIETGWLGRYLDGSQSSSSKGLQNLFSAVNVEPTLPKSLSASKAMVPSVNNVFEFKFKTDPAFIADRQVQVDTFENIYKSFDLHRSHADLLKKTGADANQASTYLQKIVSRYKTTVRYPDGSFGNGMKFIAQMIAGGVDAGVYTVSLDGFDTHTNQLNTQNRLLKQFSEGISSFYKDLEAHGLQDDVLILAFSEFGRRVGENNGRGTDHGTAAPVYVIGSRVKGGLYGDSCSLTDLDAGDLKYKTDFRCIYATLLDKWMNADSREILGQKFDYLSLV